MFRQGECSIAAVAIRGTPFPYKSVIVELDNSVVSAKRREKEKMWPGLGDRSYLT
jgi:hypothetical protein